MPISDDSVREIQLSGKQLVFLFMAVTVVSVVIFLCGVLVGRGVQARTSMSADATTASVEETADPTAPDAAPPEAAPAGPTAVPDLGYQGRLESNTPSPEKLVEPTDPPLAPPPTTSPSRSGPAVQNPAAAPSAAPRRNGCPDKTPGRPRQPETATMSGTTATSATTAWP